MAYYASIIVIDMYFNWALQGSGMFCDSGRYAQPGSWYVEYVVLERPCKIHNEGHITRGLAKE